jgi:hypothetical protein
MKRSFFALALMVLSACAIGESVRERVNPSPKSVAMVLLDISASTHQPDIRDRYLSNFQFMLRRVDGVGDGGSFLAGDVIDSNPLAHGALPIRATFRPCGVGDNSDECARTLEDRGLAVRAQLEDLAHGLDQGTDIIGAIQLADESYFSAYNDELPERLLILSDMVQSSGPFSASRILRLSMTEIEEMLAQKRGNVASLKGIDVYVVGGGSTAPDRLNPSEIGKLQAFWRAYFAEADADVMFYGAALPRFPIGN